MKCSTWFNWSARNKNHAFFRERGLDGSFSAPPMWVGLENSLPGLAGERGRVYLFCLKRCVSFLFLRGCLPGAGGTAHQSHISCGFPDPVPATLVRAALGGKHEPHIGIRIPSFINIKNLLPQSHQPRSEWLRTSNYHVGLHRSRIFHHRGKGIGGCCPRHACVFPRRAGTLTCSALHSWCLAPCPLWENLNRHMDGWRNEWMNGF